MSTDVSEMRAIEIELHPNNMNREDGLCLNRSCKPLIHSLKVSINPCSRNKLSQLSFSGQPGPPLSLSVLPLCLLASSRLPPRPCKGPNSILSHSHTIPLSLSCTYVRPPICHWPTSSPIITHFPLVSPVHLPPM
jgi:hypothetical protein